MKNNRLKKKKIGNKVPKYKYFIATIISLFIVIFPWVSYLKIMNLNDDVAKIFQNNNGVYLDFFLYYKEILIIIFGVFLLFFYCGEIIFPDNKINNYPLKHNSNRLIIICVFIYSFTVVLSSILSKYRSVTLMGSPTEGEGMLVLLGYMILFLAGLNYFSYEKSINILKKSIIVLMTIIVILTLIEFLYKPIFEIPFFKQFLANREYKELLNSLVNKDYKDMVSLTLYNPNYFGGLCVLLFPISITSFINEKGISFKFYLALLSMGMVFATIVAKSTASTYILLMECFILIILYRKTLIKNIKVTGMYIITFMFIFIIINSISDNKLLKVSTATLTNEPSIINNNDKFNLKDIILDGYVLKICGESHVLNININKNSEVDTLGFKFFNENKEEILPIIEGDIISFIDEEFKEITIENLQYGIVVDIGYNDTMQFYITPEGFKGVGQNGVEIDTIKRDKSFLSKYYSIATGRGYTWVNTLPMLKNSLLWGSGPGTFAFNFQQNDYVGLMNTHGSTKFAIDKPHNMYLQIATQTGCVGLVALLIIFGSAIKKSIKVYLKMSVKSKNPEFALGMGMFIGIVGFLIVALVNDSIVTVNPIFWILIGANFSILHFLNRETEV